MAKVAGITTVTGGGGRGRGKTAAARGYAKIMGKYTKAERLNVKSVALPKP
jgi:hypothetical protein